MGAVDLAVICCAGPVRVLFLKLWFRAGGIPVPACGASLGVRPGSEAGAESSAGASVCALFGRGRLFGQDFIEQGPCHGRADPVRFGDGNH